MPELLINSPAAIAGICAAGGAAFGPPLTAAGTTGDVVLANDGVGVGSDACTALPAGSMTGEIGLVDRGGGCAFTLKVKNAQNAGAIGVVVADNVAGPVAGMAGVDPTITIPSLRITLAHGNLIKGQLTLGQTVNVTLKTKGSGTPEDSYRWLMGEDATAFGGAIRDMWNPVCLSDPARSRMPSITATSATVAASTRTRACRTTAMPCSWTAARSMAARSRRSV